MSTTAPIRWGILGPGNIARQFATGLSVIDDAELVAVGSRTRDRADAFGDEFDVARRHASYEDLVADPDVDVIYVATPHSLHRDSSLLCLESGKAVLCEKPFALNAAQAAEMIAVARNRNLFLMEAMWTRFIPAVVKAREWIAAGAIGEPRLVAADFGFRAGVNPQGRLFDPALGGGALLDVGIYTISFAAMVLGSQPCRIESLATMGETGVDEQSAFILGYDGGEMAVLYTAVRTSTPVEARVLGTEGRILVQAPFFKSGAVTLEAGGSLETVELPLEGNGYNYQAVEVMECLRAGRTESDTMPLDETLDLMKIMDQIRAQWGLTYPGE
ncbi:Gfo/Idh/MocA family protein [Candidatus Latescibacterota bacterium]